MQALAVWMLWGVLAGSVRVDAVSDEGTYGSTFRSESNARVAFFSNDLTLSLGFGDAWLLDASYTLSRSGDSPLVHTPSLSATHAFSDQWILAVGVLGSPPTRSEFPICVTLLRRTECGAVTEQLWSVGGTALVSFDTAKNRAFDWGIDAGYSPTRFALTYRRASVLPSAEGLEAVLWQHRIGLGAIAHLFRVVDLQLNGAYFAFHGADPEVLQVGLTQLTGGLPMAPRQWEVGGGVTAFFLDRKLSARAKALFAPYVSPCAGSATLIDLRVTGRPGPVRIWGSVVLQLDRPPRDEATRQLCSDRLGQALTARAGTYGSLGAEYLF